MSRNSNLGCILDLRCIHCGIAAPDLLCETCLSGLLRDSEPACDCCGMHLPSGSPRCDGCSRRDRSIAVHALFCDSGVGASLFAAYKHSGCRRVLSFVFGLQQSPRLHSVLDNAACLIPVPPSRTGMRTRGWDPALVLARELARRYKLPVRPVLRRRHGAQQKSLGAAQRQGALARMLSVHGTVPGAIVLVDDLSTTGASLESCAQVLSERAMPVLGAVVLARHLPIPFL